MKHILINLLLILNSRLAFAEVMWTVDEQKSPNIAPAEVSSTNVKDLKIEDVSDPEAKKPSSLPNKNKKQDSTDQAISVRNGNLPRDLTSRNFSKLESTQSSIVLPNQNIRSVLSSLKVGDQLKAKINHSIIAFPDEKSPVIATVTTGNLEGAKLLGESRLEPNTKRIFITFNQIRVGGKVYAFKGDGLTSDLQPGFEGEYHSREATYFTGDFISSVVAAYFDGLVPRTTNVLGVPVEDTSVDSAFKKGLAGGAMASANRFKEKLNKVPEFSELLGPIETEILATAKGVEL